MNLYAIVVSYLWKSEKGDNKEVSKTTKGFIYTGLIYLLIGVILGSLFLFFPGLRKLSTVHAHLNLVGFVTFVIFGVSYHILPRFRGKPLKSEGLAWFQFWLANVGLVAMLAFMTAEAYSNVSGLMFLQGISGAILALSFLLFIGNMMATLL